MTKSVIGALRVNLGLDSAKFTRGLKDVDKSVARMKRQFVGVATAVAAIGAALGAAALAGAKQIDETAKSARRLDASIGGFRALELAAGEAGVSLSGLTNDIQTMNREISTIGTSGNGKRALDALALSVEDLAGKDADEKLAIIADQVKALGLNAGQTTAVLRDLGVRNREMARLVLGGGEAIRSARSDIEAYGLAISDVDAGRIEVANDALGRLGLIGQYAGQQLAVSLVPAMGAFAVVMTDSLREGGLLRAMIDGLVGNIDVLAFSAGVAVTAFGVRYVGAFALAKLSTFSLVGALATLKTALIATGIGALVVGAGYLIAKFVDLVAATGGWGTALSALGDLASGVWSGIKISAKSIAPSLNAVWSMVQSSFFGMLSNIQENWSRFLGDLGQDLADVPGLGTFADKILQTSGMAAGASARFDAKAQSAARSAERLRSAASSLASQGFEKAREAAQRLSDIVSKSKDDLDDAASGLAEVESAATGGGSGGAAGGLKKTADAAKDTAKAFTGKLSTAVDSVADAFGDWVSSGFKNFKGMVDSIKDAFKKMLSDLISTAVANPIKLALGMGGTAGASSVLGGGGGGLLGGLTSTVIGGFGPTAAVGGGLSATLGSLAGGTGFLGGAGSVLAGLGTGGLAGGGAAISAAVGGASAGLGGLAMAAGAVAVPLLAVAAAFSFFKKKTKVLDDGIKLTVNEMDSFIETFETIQTKRFWGLSKKVHTELEKASAAVADPISKMVGQIQTGAIDAAESLGIGADAFRGFSHVLKVSTKGLSQEDAQKALVTAMGGLGNAFAGMIPELTALEINGEGASATLQRLSTSLLTVNDVFKDLGFALMDTSLLGGSAAASFAGLFGTLDDFRTSTASYYDKFYSGEEKLTNATKRLTASLSDLGINFVPDTNKAYRDLVETAMLGGDQDLAAELIKLSPAFDSVVVAANQAADTLASIRDPYRLDSSGYASSFDAKIAYEAANQGKISQELITAQNVELKRQSTLLEAMNKELVKRNNTASDALTLSQIG